MIDKSELIRIAKKTGVNHPEIVEQEYVNGIVIDALSRLLDKKDFAIFGGTCRNKAYNGLRRTYAPNEIDSYFNTNRFSKDIDAFINPELNNQKVIVEILWQCVSDISNRFGIQIDPTLIRIKDSWRAISHKDSFPLPCVDATFPYYGPLFNPKHPPSRIKLSLDSNDPPVMDTTRAPIYHPFSDNGDADLVANCVAYPELFAKKLFALYNRRLGKDLYDVAILMETYDIMSHLGDIENIMNRKKKNWGMDPVPAKLDAVEVELKRSWDNTIPKMVSRPIGFDGCVRNLHKIHDALRRNDMGPVVANKMERGK